MGVCVQGVSGAWLELCGLWVSLCDFLADQQRSQHHSGLHVDCERASTRRYLSYGLVFFIRCGTVLIIFVLLSLQVVARAR